MEFKISKYPLPQEVQDDDKNERSKETIANRYSTLMEKLKTLDSSSTSGRSGKSERKLYQRCCHVLNPAVQDQDSLKQVISYDQSDLYVSFGVHKDSGSLASAKTTSLLLTEDCKKEVEKVTPGDQIHTIKPKLGRKALKKEKKAEREKTKGDKWYGMPATEVTEEIKNDLEILKMRGALDPKRFYKKSSNQEVPKYFQVGRYLDSPADYYVEGKGRKSKKSLVDELMADAEFQRYNKRKYTEIITDQVKHAKKKDRKKMSKKLKLSWIFLMSTAMIDEDTKCKFIRL